MGFNPFKFAGKVVESAIHVVAEPVKGVVNEVLDVGSDVGESVGKGVRRVAGPFIGIIDDMHNALMPRFRFDLNVKADVSGRVDSDVGINWPRTTDLNINLQGIPGLVTPPQSTPPVVGDLTGGFFSNISADRERLRWVRRRLQLLKHIAQRGHRYGADDTFMLLASYTPDDPWGFCEAQESDQDGYLPTFRISVREPAQAANSLTLRVSDLVRSRLVEHKKQLAFIAKQPPLDVKDVVVPALRRETPSATERLNLLRMSNPEGDNFIELEVASVSNIKIHKDGQGMLCLTLIRQSAYLRDSVFFAEFKVKGDAQFAKRTLQVNASLSKEFGRTTSADDVFRMNKGNSSKIVETIDAAIAAAAPLKLNDPTQGLNWQDRAFEMNMRLAEKTETVALHFENLKEMLRDLGSEDAIDVRGKAVGCFRPLSGKALCTDLTIRLQTNGPCPLLTVNRLELGEHVTFNTPITSEKVEGCDLFCAWKVPQEGNPVEGEQVAQIDLSYGWLDALETCFSTIQTYQASGQPFPVGLQSAISFKCKNHFSP